MVPVMIYIHARRLARVPSAGSYVVSLGSLLHMPFTLTRVTKSLSQTVCRSADLYLGRVSLLASLLSIDSKRVVTQWQCQIGRNK